MTAKSKAEYDMQYAKEKLKRIPLNVQKEKFEEIKTAAESQGESVNGFIKATLDSKLSEIVIPLKKSINLNENLQEELDSLLLEHSDTLSSYSRESCSDGTANLVLSFKNTALISNKTIEAFKALLSEHEVLS